MKRVLIINQDKGIFLGESAGYAVFSRYDPIGIPFACGFETDVKAKYYMSIAMPMHANNVTYAEVDTFAEKYIPVSDIIKSGYIQHTYNMLMHVPSPSESLH